MHSYTNVLADIIVFYQGCGFVCLPAFYQICEGQKNKTKQNKTKETDKNK